VVDVRLVDVGADNWRACAALGATEDQRLWVADVTYYLCLCAYGETWHPLAIEVGEDIVGFLMWGVDDDASRWIGGLVIDAAHQRRGIAKAAMVQTVRLLITQEGCTGVALSYGPDNEPARSLYAGLGFVQTGESEDEGAELVSRLSMPAAQKLVASGAPDIDSRGDGG
jgi:diamine N-acetyltransferase